MIKICSLFSGSSGNSMLIDDGVTAVIVDAGVSALRIKKELAKVNTDLSRIKGILITHEHTDHTKGIEVLARRNNIPIYGNNATLEEAGLLSCLPNLCHPFITGKEFLIDGIKVNSFSVPHDASEPVGFRLAFEKSGKEAAIATDMGYVSSEVRNGLLGVDFAVVESNHDVNMLTTGAYPYFLKRRILSKKGHLSNEDCADLCCDLVNSGTKTFVLGHLSRENNLPQLANMTTAQKLLENNIKVGEDVALDIAERDGAGKIFNL